MTRRRTAAVPMIASALLIATAAFIVKLAVVPPHLVDRCGSNGESRSSAPIVVVGVLSTDTLVMRPVPMHSAPTIPLQLRKLTVQIENVLKGGPLPYRVTVYYFTWAGGFD